MPHDKWKGAAAALALFAVNAWITIWLFRTAYTVQMGSIEGAFIGLARYIAGHSGELHWFPLWYGGVPFPDSYPPLLHAVVAAVASIAHISAGLAYHVVVATVYALGPVALYLGGSPVGRGPRRGIHGRTAVFPAVAFLLAGARNPRRYRRMVRPPPPHHPGPLRGRTAPGFAARLRAGYRSPAPSARKAASVPLSGSRPGAGRRGAEQLDRRLRAGGGRGLLPAGRVGRRARHLPGSALAACGRHRMLCLCPGDALGHAIHHPHHPHQRAQAGGLGVHRPGTHVGGGPDRGRSAAGLDPAPLERRAARALRPHVPVGHGGGYAGRLLAAHQDDSPAGAVPRGNGPGLLAHRHAGRRTAGGAFRRIVVAGGAQVRLGGHRSGLPAGHRLPAPPRPRTGEAHRHLENGRVSHLALAGRQYARPARVRSGHHRVSG